jgi:hypothetical protein
MRLESIPHRSRRLKSKRRRQRKKLSHDDLIKVILAGHDVLGHTQQKPSAICHLGRHLPSRGPGLKSVKTGRRSHHAIFLMIAG